MIKAITANICFLGATIGASHAEKQIQPRGLVIFSGLKIGVMARMITPYPTLGEINERFVGSYYTPILFGPRTRWLMRLLGWLR